MNLFYKTITFLAATAIAVSCAQEIDESAESVQKRILEAYIKTNYPDAEPSASGLYIVDSIPGTGRTPDDTSYVHVDYENTYMDGTFSSYTSDSIAKILGTYSYSGYYEPRIWSLRNNSAGIREILTGMKEGGSVKAIIPASLLDEESGMEIIEGDGSTRIYDIYLRKVIDNPDLYQIGELEEYADTRYNGLDSTEYGFYFIKTTETNDTVSNQANVNIRYVGKFLNGTVFDTNIQDTAIKYRIYNASNGYSAASFQYFDDEEKTMEENSFIDGFNKGLYRMKYGESAVVFFYSPLGYGENGSGDIPGYVPLCFELWIEEQAETEQQ